MSIRLGNRTIADVQFSGVHGARMVGGYVLRLSLTFNVFNWEPPQVPTVIFGPSRVFLGDAAGQILGFAHPEVPLPFPVRNFALTGRVLYDLALTPGALEAIERHRNGQGIRLLLKLQPEIRSDDELVIGHEDVLCAVSLSDWLSALEQAGFGRSLLFEVPVPDSTQCSEQMGDRLEAARAHLAGGRYSEAVAACRVALEALTSTLSQADELREARDLHKKNRQELDLAQRELLMRQAAMEFSHLAHHASDVPQTQLFDRNAAQLMLGTTAALVSSALARRPLRSHIA